MKKRVVITGIGAISPIGNTINEMWDGIKETKSGINPISLFDASTFKVNFAAEVKNYDPLKYFDLKQSKRLDRSSQFVLIAAREAFADSKITKENTDFNRIGAFISSGIGGMNAFQDQCFVDFEKGHSRISPMFIPMVISNMPAGNVTIDLGIRGESIAIASACASSTHAIGEAYRNIANGYEDAIVVGGTEATICEVGMAGFENMKAISTADDITRASIPFDKERNGFVMGEGAAILVLEDLEHAKKRGANIYAEVIGYGASSDAYHITSPCPDGDGAVRAMERAIEDANINPSSIKYINAHGTSTHLNDLTETVAIKTVFKENVNDVYVSSTKGNTGHLLGAAGAIEAIICVKALQEQLIPPTINYKVKDEECDLNLVVNSPKKVNFDIAMSNSLGFGGHNASLLLKKYEE